ncbi:MAG: dephospho-CoA kinase [Gammaproteobacteria bacterium]|nr:dephospho-CoA kinase [Gammaproteobacteria bacterium]
MRIGLTGGIASGKSTVADMFSDLGVAIVDTDIISREVVEPGQPALEDIRDRFGEGIVGTDGQLMRKALRKIVFDDEQARLDLEAILHPRIGDEVRRQADIADGSYQIIVVPLLVGSALLDFVDRVLVVDCDEDVQIQRLLARDTETIEQAQKILAAQASREERLQIADDIIRNGGSLRDSRRQVSNLDQYYQQLAARRSAPEQHS